MRFRAYNALHGQLQDSAENPKQRRRCKGARAQSITQKTDSESGGESALGQRQGEESGMSWATPQQQAQNTSKAKLTQPLADEIRQLEGTASATAIARRYNVTHSRVSAIWKGEAWRR
jgi:hypothetical protein